MQEKTELTGKRRLSIIIPAYNEEVRLPPTIEKIYSYIQEGGYDAEIIVVDDGSRDRTSEKMRKLQAVVQGLRIIRHEVNTGKDFAVRAGIRAAKRETILFTDADLSTPIEDIELLWPWYDQGHEVVIGSRRHRDSRILVPQPLYRRILGRTLNRIIRVLCVRGYQDTQCGFKLFNREALLKIEQQLRTRGFAFDVELLMRAKELGYKTKEVGVRWSNVKGTRMRVIHHGTRMILQLVQLSRLAKQPSMPHTS